MARLKLEKIVKSFGAVDVIKGVDLDIADKEFVVFVGPSGCGKSTLLRLIAGLEEISGGDLTIDGERVNDVPPDARGLAMVFQTYALYPHMTVAENMGFALKLAGVPKAERDDKVNAVARLLQLDKLLDRKPRQLSGGQRQRVAIGRAMVRQPRVFLFDEPLSNLDAALRVQMRIELARLHDRLGVTMIYVTHDQVEAMTLADKIVVLRDGRVEQVGSPLTLYHRPVNRFVAGFIGSPTMNFLPVELVAASAAGATVKLGSGATVDVPVDGSKLKPGAKLTLGIRPEHTAAAADGPLTGEVMVVERLGGQTYLYVQVGGPDLMIVETDGDSRVRVHERVAIAFKPADCHLFDADGLTVPPLQPHVLADLG
ncbi:ABC transporter ATP-binding protein [Oharaeibacter diazotrophicus]|uniref:Maltooligosaccharide ABC transporter ATP-binding protein n=1 Tax=Oharaeibacter diazotrophicus TaxID=1920512 RepID=A0A4R6RFK3_9HYPH|nr:sn-glycerol-3-phosphate ABC transporter ATP-binding protein UgpC [Oharaeibacter diazotrophicus]TDP85040.1 maltooligosaccharide ABC transporter ATP-binding protein [Oharaeibacter diazotrophicus]BBE74010.1 maltose/maltodextrin import ATP-binding protein MalK [Pleomorphomonas sp. SM30]GLS76302.1 sugar ABC transporter ATP-binding protein [Oharaeibacter diazotrophicus]